MTKPIANDGRIISLPKVTDPHGKLLFREPGEHVPFGVKRVFYLNDMPTEEGPVAHAHKAPHQFLICLSGSFGEQDYIRDHGSYVPTVTGRDR